MGPFVRETRSTTSSKLPGRMRAENDELRSKDFSDSTPILREKRSPISSKVFERTSPSENKYDEPHADLPDSTSTEENLRQPYIISCKLAEVTTEVTTPQENNNEGCRVKNTFDDEVTIGNFRVPVLPSNEPQLENVNNVDDKRSQVLKENTMGNVMRDKKSNSRTLKLTEDHLNLYQEENQKENIFLNWITSFDNNEIWTEKNLLWGKLSSPEFSEEHGNVYIVFDEKIYNHPMCKREFKDDYQSSSDEFEIKDVLCKQLSELPGKQVNGTSSPHANSCDSGDNGSKCNSLMDCSVENNDSSNVKLVNGVMDKVRSEKNENDPVGNGEKNVNCGGGDMDTNESFESDSIKEEDPGGGGGSDGNGSGGGDHPKNLEFLDKADGSNNLRTKLDAAHWEMLHDYLKSALLKSREEFTKNLESQVALLVFLLLLYCTRLI